MPVHIRPRSGLETCAPGSDALILDEAGAGSTADDVPESRASRLRRVPGAGAVLGFIAIAALVWFVVFWSVLHPPAVSPVQAPVAGAAALPAVFRGWAHWDANWYASISRDGYSYQRGAQSSVAFFPVYPMVIHGIVAMVPGANRLVVGSLATLTAGVAAAALFWRWCRDRLPASSATTAVLLLAVYPYSVYLYGPVYADALFLALTLAAFVLLERDHVVGAALVGALATGSRPAGIIVAVALIARLIEQRAAPTSPGIPRGSGPGLHRWHRPPLKRGDYTIVAAAGGFVGYCVYLGCRFGDPFAFATVQGASGWDQNPGPHTWFKLDFFAEVTRAPFGPAALGLVLQLGFALLALATVPAIGRRFGWSYALLVGLIVAMPLIATKDFQGTGRYLLPAFPVAAIAGHGLAQRPHLRAAVLTAGVATIALFSSWFAKGNYLS